MVCCALSVPAYAFDSFAFRLEGGPDSLETALQRASLLAQADAEDVGDPLEIFSTARAEYGRLIGVFYEAGFYAPQISVRIDGREAADISPLEPPTRIDEIVVSMAPGPAFQFAQAQIAPLADGTGLPASFAPGAPARSTVIREATGAALDRWRALGHAKAEPVGQAISARHPARALMSRSRWIRGHVCASAI